MLLPVCILIALAIKLEDGDKIFYAGQRIGFSGKIFKMLKFRTLREGSGQLSLEETEEFLKNFKLKSDRRVTRVGYLLRRYGLDEIPQFINVLKGEMSLIGPRPKLPEEIHLYKEDKAELLSVLPGITGYWQVYRKDASSDENMRKMDIFYIRNRNGFMDIKLLFMTLAVIISRKNY